MCQHHLSHHTYPPRIWRQPFLYYNINNSISGYEGRNCLFSSNLNIRINSKSTGAFFSYSRNYQQQSYSPHPRHYHCHFSASPNQYNLAFSKQSLEEQHDLQPFRFFIYFNILTNQKLLNNNLALVKIRFSASKMKVTCLTSGTSVCVFFQWPADSQWWENQF